MNSIHISISEKINQKTFLTWPKRLVSLVLYCLVRKVFWFIFPEIFIWNRLFKNYVKCWKIISQNFFSLRIWRFDLVIPEDFYQDQSKTSPVFPTTSFLCCIWSSWKQTLCWSDKNCNNAFTQIDQIRLKRGKIILKEFIKCVVFLEWLNFSLLIGN